MSVQNETKLAVSVAEMARMVGLSRSRFYQLIGTVFPEPERQQGTGRPIYTEELQRVCLGVRKRNSGIDGRFILFNARRGGTERPKPKVPKPKREPKGDVSALAEGLNALGLATATASQVERATKELFPGGTGGTDRGEVLRAVFLRLRREDSDDDVKR